MSMTICSNTPGAYPEIGAYNEVDKQLESSGFSSDSSLILNKPEVRQYWSSVSSHISRSGDVFTNDKEKISSSIGEDAMDIDASPSLIEKYNSFPTRQILPEQDEFENDVEDDASSSLKEKSQGSCEIEIASEISSEILNGTSADGNSEFHDFAGPPPSQNESVALSFSQSNDLDFLNNPSGSGSSNDINRSTSSISLPRHVSLDFNVYNSLCLTNEVTASESHNVAKFHLGKENKKSLLPRWKTIEMYGEVVKKTQDIYSNFQYAQYILRVGLDTEKLHELVKELEDESNSFTLDSLKEYLVNDAKVILKKLSAVGYPDAQYLLGDAYSSGVFGKIKNRRAFLLFSAAAKRMHIESVYRTAICYECGLGVTRNAPKAVNFLTFAATKNHPAAMYKLGVYSYHGLMGLPDDILTKMDGYRWLRRATSMASSFVCGAPFELANIYMTGYKDLIISDPDYAMALYEKAAALGHTESARILEDARRSGGFVSRGHPPSAQKYHKTSHEAVAAKKLI
ncbi:Shc1p [Saccharomyces cerevisiae YJM1549]|nr:Shc1p [Saccharomyces cerevisiae YJM1549]